MKHKQAQMNSVLRRIINKFVEVHIRKCRQTFSTKPQIDAKNNNNTCSAILIDFNIRAALHNTCTFHPRQSDITMQD